LLVNTDLPQMRSSGSMMAADLIAVQLRKHASAASLIFSRAQPRIS